MVHLLDNVTVAISANRLELAALKKLSLVSHALATKLGDYRAQEEQKTLAMTLDEIIRRIEIGANGALS